MQYDLNARNIDVRRKIIRIFINTIIKCIRFILIVIYYKIRQFVVDVWCTDKVLLQARIYLDF